MSDTKQHQIIQNCKLALPDGLQELMSDISREVLRSQPKDVCNFITEYLGALLETRDKLAIAARICDEVCHGSCQPELEDELKEIGLSDEEVTLVGNVVQKYFEKGQDETVHATLLYELSQKINVDDSVLEEILDAVMLAFRRHLVNNAVKYETVSSEDYKDDTATKAAKNTVNFYKSKIFKDWDPETQESEENKHDENEMGCINEWREENNPGSHIDLPSQEPYDATESCLNNFMVDESPQETTQYKYEATEVVGVEEEGKTPEERNKKESLAPVSSMALAGSYISLPKNEPYPAPECSRQLSLMVDESPEKEQMSLDYTVETGSMKTQISDDRQNEEQSEN